MTKELLQIQNTRKCNLLVETDSSTNPGLSSHQSWKQKFQVYAIRLNEGALGFWVGYILNWFLVFTKPVAFSVLRFLVSSCFSI